MNLFYLFVMWLAWPVTYGKGHDFHARQTLSVTKSEAEMTAGDLRPLVSAESEPFVYEYALLRGTPLEGLPVSLRYRDGNGQSGAGAGWQLMRPEGEIAANGCRLLFDYEPTEEIPLLRSIRLLCGSHTTQWTLDHERDPVRGEEFLTRIGALHFSYQFMNARRETDWCSPDLPAGSVWKAEMSVDNKGRWLLPEGKSIHSSPGLRFVKLNLDPHLDLVDGSAVDPAAWLWNPALRRWDKQLYKPARPVVRGRRPTGTVYSQLWKDFPDDRFNTSRHLSLVTSYYQPADDGKSLVYRSAISFPRVFNSVLRPDGSGNVWEEVTDQRLTLPVPLQYEGLNAWPKHLPGISAEESYRNQGAQFVRFTDDGSPNLLYVGLRYRDAGTGRVLAPELAPHRDTANCRPWREETWQQQPGGARRVKIDLCQGFWKGRDAFWSDDMVPEGESFWERLDLDERGRPTDRYILPWKDGDPAYYHHYVAFRDVRFCSFDKGRPFLVVLASGPAGRVADIYRLRGDQWVPVPEDSRHSPPKEALHSSDVLFIDVNADRVDDAVIPRGPRKGTWINLGKTKPHWKRCPAYELPWQADLKDGKAQLIDLNGDEAQDLFIGNGSLVFMNQSLGAGKVRDRMASFTDETGRQRRVE